MSRTIRSYPHGLNMADAEASRDGHRWHEPGERFAKRHANRLGRRNSLTNRERRAAFTRIVY